MGILQRGDAHDVPRLDLELTPGCDHKCGHCYNVWNAEDGDPQAAEKYPKGQLSGERYLQMVEKIVRESGADHITVTGGEPLLRKNALEIIERACQLVSSVHLITNGSHVTPETARRLAAAGVKSVQLTLLSADPAKHDLLKGAACFDDTVRAALDLRDAGVPVQCCFVAMRHNWRDFEAVMELCFVLGIRAISYNRMSPTGGAIHHIARLLPDVEHVEANLETAERLGRAWKIQVATAMPIPPCLIRIDRFKWVKFGFCSTGTASPNIVVDALGNVRSCNLSSGLLGNIVEQSWSEIARRAKDPYQQRFKKTLPALCRGCRYASSCQGGCKESAFATFGALDHLEPFLQQAIDPEFRARLAADRQPACCAADTPCAGAAKPAHAAAGER